MNTLVAIVLRCVIVYIYLLIVLRLAGKRTIAEGSPFDLIVALIISDLPDNMIMGNVQLVQGLVAMGTLMLVHVLVTLGVAHSQTLNRIIEGVPTPIIRHGQLLERNLRFERVDGVELNELLREARIDAREQVEVARLEPSGSFTAKRTPEADYARKRDLTDRSA